MANCTRTSAQCANDPASDQSIDAATLALRAVDEVSNLRDIQLAYNCLESLLACEAEGDDPKPHATRAELCALMGLMNEAMDIRMEAVELSTRSVHESLIQGGAGHPRSPAAAV